MYMTIVYTVLLNNTEDIVVYMATDTMVFPKIHAAIGNLVVSDHCCFWELC